MGSCRLALHVRTCSFVHLQSTGFVDALESDVSASCKPSPTKQSRGSSYGAPKVPPAHIDQATIFDLDRLSVATTLAGSVRRVLPKQVDAFALFRPAVSCCLC